MDFFGYGEGDWIPCEMCNSTGVDIHHIEKQSKFGSKKEKDFIENIMCLCRDCHIKAESDSLFNMYCRIKHLEFVCQQVYALIDLKKKLNR
jgi:hypothetical protein